MQNADADRLTQYSVTGLGIRAPGLSSAHEGKRLASMTGSQLSRARALCGMCGRPLPALAMHKHTALALPARSWRDRQRCGELLITTRRAADLAGAPGLTIDAWWFGVAAALGTSRRALCVFQSRCSACDSARDEAADRVEVGLGAADVVRPC